MIPRSKESTARPYPYVVLIALILLSASLAIVALKAPSHQQRIPSIFKLGYLVGPATQSLLSHQGLQVCTEDMGTPGDPICFRSARMPIASIVLATGVRLFGDHPADVATGKVLVCMVPLWAAMGLVLGTVRRIGGNLVFTAFLLLLPFVIVNYLVVITGMEIEEGYLFGLLPLALALIVCVPRPGMAWALVSAVALDLIYFAKSSMLPAVFVLLVACVIRLPRWSQRLVIVMVVGLAPVSWAVHQHAVSGRFSLGTSLDGINLHKGNNDQFQNRYPISNASLDSSDSQLNKGLYFTNEWTFSDYHLAQARQFVLSHPSYTAESDARKAFVILLSLKSYNVTPLGPGATFLTEFGLVIFRLLLWSSLLLAVLAVVRRRGSARFFGCVYLGFVAAYCLPYIIGFGFIRHAIVLAYPAAIFCALSLCPVADEPVAYPPM